MIEQVQIDALIQKSRSYNGYDRESALRQLSDVKDERVFPILVERLNDWVPQVRYEAYLSIKHWISVEWSGFLLSHFKTLCYLQLKTRLDHSKLLDQIKDIFGRSEFLREIRAFILSQQGIAPRTLADWAIEQSWFSKEDAEYIFPNSVDILVRQKWLKSLNFKLLAIEERNYVLDGLLQSKYKDVQMAGFRAAIKSFYSQEDAVLLAKKMLNSRHGSVRASATYILRKYDFDFLSYFQQQVTIQSTAKQRVAWIQLIMLLKKECLYSILDDLVAISSNDVKLKVCKHLIEIFEIERGFKVFDSIQPSELMSRTLLINVMVLLTSKYWSKSIQINTYFFERFSLCIDEKVKVILVLPFWEKLAQTFSLFLAENASKNEPLSLNKLLQDLHYQSLHGKYLGVRHQWDQLAEHEKSYFSIMFNQLDAFGQYKNDLVAIRDEIITLQLNHFL